MVRVRDAEDVYRAAQSWRERCLLADGSVFTSKSLWTEGIIAYLDRYFVKNLDTGEGDFYQKLEKQLELAPPEAKRLAAEMLWVLFLFPIPRSMAGTTKRLQLKMVWEWSGKPLPEAEFELGPVLDTGIGHPGTAFQTQRWREFKFLILAVRDLKSIDSDRRERLLNEPWEFAEWLSAHEESKGRQLYHILTHLLFPDHFEPIGTGRHKKLIIDRFTPGTAIDYRKNKPAVDRHIMTIRETASEEFGEDFSFYHPDVAKLWQGKQPSSVAPDSPPDEVEEWYSRRIGGAKVWAWSPGRGARLWPELQAENLMAIGWDYLGDLMEYDSKAAIAEAIRSNRDSSAYPTNSSLACWQFSREIQKGDFVLVKKGTSSLLGWGVVESDYEYREDRSEFQHCRRTRWERLGQWALAPGSRITPKTLTESSSWKQWVYHAFKLMEEGGENGPTTDGWTQDLFISDAQFSEIMDALGRKKNIIIQGPPGTGKTFIARRLAWALKGEVGRDRLRMVQFHQSYSYEDFIQGWRPTGKGGFELKPGPFYAFCKQAQEDPRRPYVFVIDEINRGNLSRIFGELLMLIETDKRGAEHAIPLTYSEEPFAVPENVYLIGTMNTADRSLALVDYALRRRFVFIDLVPAFGAEPFIQFLDDRGVEESTIRRVMARMDGLNRVIRQDQSLGRGYEVGHSYFCPQEGDEELDESWYERIVKTEIAPLLREYWFDDDDRYREEVQRLLS